MSVVVVVPSRGRPNAARQTLAAIRDTASLVRTTMIIAVDADDPELESYLALGRRERHDPSSYSVECSIIVLQPEETGNLVRATNTVALRVAREDPSAIIGNLGDDHRPRTSGWDAEIAAALMRPGLAYGDDGIHGEHLPSAPFVSAELVLALGWYFHPALEHMYVDDTWRELATAAGCRNYLPNVLIEHMHPDVGKGEWDELYRKVNAEAAVVRDRVRYQDWLRAGLADDVARIRAASQVAA